MNANTLKLDVRDDIRSGGDPFAKIMKAVATLAPDTDLLLLAPFEPVPLYFVLEKKGFTHESKPLPTGDWEVRFTRTPRSSRRPPSEVLLTKEGEEAPIPSENNNHTENGTTNQAAETSSLYHPMGEGQGEGLVPAQARIDLDARGLEPPQPLVTILEALLNLPNNSALHARTDRRPMHLYPQLEARGFRATTEEQTDGTFITKIQR